TASTRCSPRTTEPPRAIVDLTKGVGRRPPPSCCPAPSGTEDPAPGIHPAFPGAWPDPRTYRGWAHAGPDAVTDIPGGDMSTSAPKDEFDEAQPYPTGEIPFADLPDRKTIKQ